MAEEGQVISCHTTEQWNEQLAKGNESKKLTFSVHLKSGIRAIFLGSLEQIRTFCRRRGEELERSLPEIRVISLLIVVDFTASWCGPCRLIAPILAEMAKKLPNVIFLKVDVDELKTVASDWAVEAMPTFMFLKEGKIVDKVVGAKKEELQLTVNKHMTAA